MQHFLTSWSGGKDSCFAMMQTLLYKGYKPVALLNMMNENGLISRSHAIPKHILQKQAAAVNLPIITIPATWAEYEEKYILALKQLKGIYKISDAVFGDIDLQPHKDWEEKVCAAAGIKAILPLWQQERKQLVLQMIDKGIEAYIVSCNEIMGKDFLGKRITEDLIKSLEKLGVDACGENGEYHTLVIDCTMFKNKINVEFGTKLHHGKYWFIEMK